MAKIEQNFLKYLNKFGKKITEWQNNNRQLESKSAVANESSLKKCIKNQQIGKKRIKTRGIERENYETNILEILGMITEFHKIPLLSSLPN